MSLEVRMSQTPITEDQAENTIADALAAAERFGLKPADSRTILREVFTQVSAWRKTGRQLRLDSAVLKSYASAFENPAIAEAARLLRR